MVLVVSETSLTVGKQTFPGVFFNLVIIAEFKRTVQFFRGFLLVLHQFSPLVWTKTPDAGFDLPTFVILPAHHVARVDLQLLRKFGSKSTT